VLIVIISMRYGRFMINMCAKDRHDLEARILPQNNTVLRMGVKVGNATV